MSRKFRKKVIVRPLVCVCWTGSDLLLLDVLIEGRAGDGGSVCAQGRASPPCLVH